MAFDRNNRFIVTADGEGFVKVWEVQEYAVTIMDQPIINPPSLQSHFQAHQDQINSLEVCERNERLLVISASSDCSVALWDIRGIKIGIFGQEKHWKIEPFQQSVEVENEEKQQREEESDKVASVVVVDGDSLWEPDKTAVTEPEMYRINTWDKTVLGKNYQTLRVQKRERKQPDLSYFHWEKTGAVLAGPYSALETKELTPVHDIVKPDTEKYFNQTLVNGKSIHPKLPVLAETLTTVFDEKSMFPNYILEFEKKMKNYHIMLLNQSQNKGNNELSNHQNLDTQTGKVGTTKPMVPGKNASAKGILGLKLYPVPEIRQNSTSTVTTFTAD